MDGSEEAAARAAETGEAVRNEDDELLELLRRERSDFLSYKRRTERERAEAREAITGDVVEKLLPVLDDLDRALSHVPPDLEEHPWAEGVALGRERLVRALDSLGVERIGRKGEPFDPTTQEAVYYQPRQEIEETRVAEVVRPGYRLGERLLRPAQVVVAGPARNAESRHHRSSHRHQHRAA